MKLTAQYEGKEIEVEIDLQKHQLAPATRIAEESGKRQAAEAQLQALQKEVGTLKSTLDLSSTRLRLAGDAAPSESAAKMARGAYNGFIDGVEKPPTFEEWSSGDGKSFLASLRPVAAAPAPAGAPNPAPAPVGAAPAPGPAPAPNIPNTNTGALTTQPAPPSNAALLKQYDDLNGRYARATPAERPALLTEITQVEAKIRAPVGAAT